VIPLWILPGQGLCPNVAVDLEVIDYSLLVY